jgi:hypothetical protein
MFVSDQVVTILSKRKPLYERKLASFEEWSCKKSGINGTCDKFIKNMLHQVLKELDFPSGKIPILLNKIYSSDFDAIRFIRIIYENSTNKTFDLLNKDKSVTLASVQTTIYALEKCDISTDNLNALQCAGLCVFIQFILRGARNDNDGFGSSPNLIARWKKETKKIIKSNPETIIKVNKEVEVEPIEIPDSWEDL